MKGEAVTLSGVNKDYGGVQAVVDVSLDIRAGEFISLLGPSGSGKTTLLMMLAGFETPTSGRIQIGARDITHVAPNRRDVGMVFQKYALFPHMTVEQNIAFPLRMRGLPRAEIAPRVRDALALVQLAGLEKRYPSQLSGGQQQRVAVARALIFEPPVLLMDEPLGALDKKLRENMQLEIKRLHQRVGVTIVYVTHDQEEALTMSDRIAVMSEGRLVQLGTPIGLYQSPESPFVADFIGKMNFLDGEYIGSEGAETVIRIAPDARLSAPFELNGAQSLLTVGSPVRLAVRPERLRLAKPGEGGASSLPGRVETAIFVGSFHIFLVSIDGRSDQPLQVQVPADSSTPKFREGDRVDLVADQSAVRLFPIGKGTAA